MEALRRYLAEMPLFSTLLLEVLGEALEGESFDHNNADEMRLAYKAAQDRSLAIVRERQVPYHVITYPQVYFKCERCREEIRGAYYEISNPLTNARGMFRVRLMHDLLVHGEAGYTEPILNMSETQLGIDDHQLDFKKLAKILDGLPLPADVQNELAAGMPAATAT